MNSGKKLSDNKLFLLCGDCNARGKVTPDIEFLPLSARRVLKKKTEDVTLFFLLEGHVEVSYGEAVCSVEKGHFFLIPSGENYNVRVANKAQLIIYQIDENLLTRYKRKEGLLYDIYNMKIQHKDYRLLLIEINRHIQSLLENFMAVIDGGFFCLRHMHYKTEELLILLRSYYPDNMLACLFEPAFNSKTDFVQIIRKNRNKLFTVEEFAAAANLDRNSFSRKFKEIYHRNPNEWIKQERIKQVFQDLVEGSKSITDIVSDYKFSNFSNFIRFCNLHYKNTPGNIRKIIEHPS